MRGKDWFSLVPSPSPLGREEFRKVVDKTSHRIAASVMVSEKEFSYALACELDRQKYYPEAAAFFLHSGLEGMERLWNALHCGRLSESRGELEAAKETYGDAMRRVEELRRRDGHMIDRPMPRKYRGYEENQYPTVQVVARLALDKAETELKKVERDIHYRLGLIAEYGNDDTSALAHYDQCHRISVDIRYLDSSLDHRPVRDAIRRVLAVREGESPYDILLINTGVNSTVPSYALLFLGTYLAQEGKRVCLLNNDASEEEILRNAARAGLVGFSVMTDQIPASLALSRKMKKMRGDTPIVWGGIHPTLYPEQVLRDGAVDFVVAGDGEETLNALVDAIMKDEPYDSISGLGFRRGDQVVVNEAGSPFDLEKIGPFRFDLMEVDRWTDIRLGKVDLPYPTFVYFAGRGCPWKCTYCVTSLLDQTRKRRKKKIRHILDDIRYLLEKTHLRCLLFWDDYFFANPKWFSSFLDQFEEAGLRLTWGASFHARVILRQKTLMLRAKNLGLKYVSFSPESGSDRVLKVLRKSITVEESIQCFEFLTSEGFSPISSFMTHLPTETEEEIKATFALRDTLQKMCDDRGVSSYLMGPQPFRPYPGTKLYKQCVERGYEEPATLEEWRRKVTAWGHSLIKEEYFWVG